MKSHLEQHHRTFGVLGALIAAIVAIIYLVIVPEELATANWLQRAILVYGHSLCWFLLCAASIIWSVKGKNRWSVPLAYAALAVYAIFIGTLLSIKDM